PDVPAMSLQLGSNILAREAFYASYQRAFHATSPSERETDLVTADVCFHHHLAELFQRRLRLPSQFALCFGWVTDEQIDLCGAVEPRVHANQSTPGLTIDTDFVLLFAFPLKVEASRCAGHSYEVTHRGGAVGSEHVRIGLIGLQHTPHAFRVFLCVAPVPLSIEITQL